MSKHRVTLKDIAERLGITVTTVSKALKDYPDISKETKKAVQKLAKELKYYPDTQALGLRGKRSNTIGIIIPEIVHFFFSNVIKGIMDFAEEKGFRVLITLSNNKLDLEKKQANLLFSTKVDGILVSLSNETKNSSHFDVFNEYEIPVVMFDKVDDLFKCSKVTIDDENGAYIATEHLINKGCKRIAHIRGPKNPLNSIKRFEGYIKALDQYNLVFDPQLVKECTEVNLQEGFELAQSLLTSPNPPDGIFAITDQVGAGIIKAANEMAINIPTDLKIVGFSDSQIAQVSHPPLTTIHQPGYEIGETAAKILIEEIELQDMEENGSPDHRRLILDTYLIERGSTS